MMLITETTADALVLTVQASRIDAASTIHFKDEFRAAATGADGRVIMDLGQVMFMDSSGLGAMVAALKALGGRKLELCALTPAVSKVFKLTRMDNVFVLHSDRADALAASAKGQDAA